MSRRGSYVQAQSQFSIKSSKALTFLDWRSVQAEPAKCLFSMPVTSEKKQTEGSSGERLRVLIKNPFRLLIHNGPSTGALHRCLSRAVSFLWRRLILLSWFTNSEPAVVALHSLRIQDLLATPSPQGSVVLSLPLMEAPLVQQFCGWLILRRVCELITQCRTHRAP